MGRKVNQRRMTSPHLHWFQSFMRGFGRLILALGLGVLLLAAGLVVFRGAILGFVLKAANPGVENLDFKVSEVGWRRLSLSDVRAGADPASPDIAVRAAEAEFDLGELLSRRRIRSLSISGGVLRASIGEDGRVSIAGLKLERGGTSEKSPPLSAVKIEDVAFELFAPNGGAKGTIGGAFDFDKGGEFRFAAASKALSIRQLTISNAALEGVLALAGNGEAKLGAKWLGDVRGANFSFRGLGAGLDVTANSWRDMLGPQREALTGAAQVNFSFAASPGEENPLLSAFFAFRPERAGAYSGHGALRISFADGSVTARLGDGEPVRIESDRGDALTLSGRSGGAAYSSEGGSQRLDLQVAAEGKELAGEARLTASRALGEPWSFEAAGEAAQYAYGAWSLEDLNFGAVGEAGARIAATGEISTRVREATVGRLAIFDTPVRSKLKIDIDPAAREISFSPNGGECVEFARTTFKLADQDSDARLGEAKLCRSDGPVLVYRWGEDAKAEVKGRLTARTGAYRLGQTRFEGLPPTVDLEADYDPEAQLTDVLGRMSDGRIILNGALVATGAEGGFAARLDPQALSGTARLDRAVITQNAKTRQIAPIVVKGSARLAEEKMSFDYAAATMRGEDIGRGEGVHDVRAGVGRTTYRSGDLVFAPGRLQPAHIISALTGIASDATGAASGEATFIWGRRPSDFQSSGAISVNELSFKGPGLAVTRTSGVKGDLQLESLSPLKSVGEARLAVKSIDLDALDLNDGVIRFSLPGDNTMRVIEAEFPWFGGRIGVYDSTAQLTGGTIETILKAADVDLQRLLAHVDIEGLSGEGAIEGVLPLVITQGKARIIDGYLIAKGPGVLRYKSKGTEAAAAESASSRIAFEALRELKFDTLTAKLNGPLDGDIAFDILVEGASLVTLGRGQEVNSPIKYRIQLEAPLMGLIDQARVTTDIKTQLGRAGKDEADKDEQ